MFCNITAKQIYRNSDIVPTRTIHNTISLIKQKRPLLRGGQHINFPYQTIYEVAFLQPQEIPMVFYQLLQNQ